MFFSNPQDFQIEFDVRLEWVRQTEDHPTIIMLPKGRDNRFFRSFNVINGQEIGQLITRHIGFNVNCLTRQNDQSDVLNGT